MKPFWFLFLICLSNCVESKKPPDDCERFRTGRFLIVSKPGGTKYILERNEDHQTEYNVITDTITGFRLKWTGDCTYQIAETFSKKKNPSDPMAPQKIIEFKNPTPLNVKIISTGKDYYIFESWQNNIPFVFKDTAWVVK